MSRNTRRGKGVRDQRRDDGILHEPASILGSILKSLDLTFERDIGLLNGKYVRSLPDKSILASNKQQIEKLGKTLEKIAAADQEKIDLIKEIREELIKKEERRIEDEKITANGEEINSETEDIPEKPKQSQHKRPLEEKDEEIAGANNELTEMSNHDETNEHIEKKSKLA